MNNKINLEYQKKTFDNIKNMKHQIQGLAGYIQNDFESILEDKITTKNEILLAILDMDKSFDTVIIELNKLRNETRDIMNYYGTS